MSDNEFSIYGATLLRQPKFDEVQGGDGLLVTITQRRTRARVHYHSASERPHEGKVGGILDAVGVIADR